MVLLGALLTTFLQGPEVTLDAAHVPKAGRYEVAATRDHAAWTVSGKNITLDLSARVLTRAGAAAQSQSEDTGVGLLLDGCENVTIKNLDVSRFKRNIVLRNCENVRILGCKAKLSRAIRMGNQGKAVDTFLNLRDIKAWDGYGFGIWLDRCTNCRVEKCVATDSQNGIGMAECTGCTVLDNDCSYNGGWGLALWNDQRCHVAWNQADFCNRPWAGGWGGDAAGIAVANGSHENVIVANSLTHSGDGFFLTDRSNGGFDKTTHTYKIEGPSNQNTIAYNDGSFSSNNAFEGTFSTGNAYYRNIANDSNYGFWLGFSIASLVFQNQISRDKADGIAIGQGRDNTLFRNVIENAGNAGIHLWSDEGPAMTDQPSINNIVESNRIANCKQAFSLERTIAPRFVSNTIEGSPLPEVFHQSAPDFSRTARLMSWGQSRDALVVSTFMQHRPANWRFYSEKIPAGTGALKVGDFAPAR